MATSIFAHLDAAEFTRANSLRLFADETRLARKPRCSQSKNHSVIRIAARALTHPYIQPNSPMAYSRIVFDLDWHNSGHRFHKLPLRYLASQHAWENDLGIPAPNWAAISKDKNSAHIGYELETPVARHAHARPKPLQYLAAIEDAMLSKLGADEGFNGQLCKNPLNSNWDLYQGPNSAWDLHDLAEYVELTTQKRQSFSRTLRGEVGRNVYLFDEVRFWAYDNIRSYRIGKYDPWEQSVIATAERINGARYEHLPEIKEHGLLPLSECRATAKGIARWVWKNHGQRTLTAAFSELQSWRGTRGAAAAATAKRERREEQILAAIGQLTAQGEIPTMGKVAKLVGCAKSALSQHYRHIFQSTMQ